MSSKKQQTGKTSYIFTKETMGITLLLFSTIVLLMLFTRAGVFAGLGAEICNFMYGAFGYGSVLICLSLIYLGVRIAFGKKINIKMKYLLTFTAAVAVLFFLIQAVVTRDFSIDSYGGYLKNCYESARAGWSGYTAGGALSGVIVYPVAKVATFVGAYVIFSVLLALCGFLMFMLIRRKFPAKTKACGGESEEKVAFERPGQPEFAPYREEERGYAASAAPRSDGRATYVRPEPVRETASADASEGDKYGQKNPDRRILFENGEFDAENYRRNMIFSQDSYFNHPKDGVESYLSNFNAGAQGGQAQAGEASQSYTESYQNEVASSAPHEAPSIYVYGDKPVENLNGSATEEEAVPPRETFTPPEPVRTEEPREERAHFEEHREERPAGFAPFESETSPRPEENREFTRGDSFVSRQDDDFDSNVSGQERTPVPDEPARGNEEKPRSILSSLFSGDSRRESRDTEERRERSDSKINLFDDDNEDDVFGERGSVNSREDAPDIGRGLRGGRTEEPPRAMREGNTAFGIPERRAGFSDRPEPPKAEPPKEEKPKHVWKKYVHPPLDLLDDYPENNNVNSGEIEDNKRVIIETLEKFKIESEVANVTVGPAITRYDVIIADRTNIKRSLSYRDEIAIALMKNNVNAYLNYAKGALSIEIPNNRRAVVGLKTMLASPQFINCKPNSLTFGLGKSVDGEVVCPNITKMPHLLVAGTTGSGKSICLNTLLVSLLYKYGPEELRLILVDPKQAEFIPFSRLPHLMINEILYDVDKVIKALNWAIKEMERRYTLFKEMTENGNATKNLDEYNAHLPEGEEKLPKILIVLDEFSDLMMQAKKEIEFKIIRLAQKARACGIHLILATQRPSVDCITGLIKSNLPSRIGFKVNSFEDSRIIFDVGGAEKLLGMGDMYFRSPENTELERIQGCFIDSHEVQKVTDFIRANNETYFDQEASDFINKVEEPEAPQPVGDGGDDAGDGKMDDTYLKALKYCVASNQASVSMIQRRFPVGYIKACKIIDWMEKMNYITQSEGSKPRKVLMSMDEFTNTYGEVDD